MKLISHNNVAPTFQVVYHGIELTIPMHFLDGYIHTDWEGHVCVSKNKPTIDVNSGYWSYGGERMYIAKVELQYREWLNSLVSIKSFNVSKSYFHGEYKSL